MIGRVVRARVGRVARSIPGARGVEPLGEQDREIGFDELRELLGRRERLVRRRVVVADVRDECGESLLAFRRLFHVDELRHLVRRESVLVVETRDVLVWGDPAVLLPVDPEEHVALLEVGPVQLPRGVGSGTELEHDGCEMKTLDGGARGHTFGFEFLEGGADEDPKALVGGADGARTGVADHEDGTFDPWMHLRSTPHAAHCPRGRGGRPAPGWGMRARGAGCSIHDRPLAFTTPPPTDAGSRWRPQPSRGRARSRARRVAAFGAPRHATPRTRRRGRWRARRRRTTGR